MLAVVVVAVVWVGASPLSIALFGWVGWGVAPFALPLSLCPFCGIAASKTAMPHIAPSMPYRAFTATLRHV